MAASLDEVLKPIRLPDDPLSASYAVGGVLQIELTRKQQLLELPDAATRLAAELALLRRESRLLSEGAMPPVAPPTWATTPTSLMSLLRAPLRRRVDRRPARAERLCLARPCIAVGLELREREPERVGPAIGQCRRSGRKP